MFKTEDFRRLRARRRHAGLAARLRAGPDLGRRHPASASSPTCPASTPTSTARPAPRRSRWRSPTWAARRRQEDRGARRRPPEQGRRRRRQGARVVRHAGRRHADRRHQLRHRLAMAKVAPEKKKLFISVGAGTLGADQRAVHAVHHPLRLRHHGARQGHRQRGRQGRRQELVLPDRRLRVRHAAAERHHRVVKAAGGTVRRLGPRIRSRRATSRRSCCRRSRARRRSSAWPTPAATRSTRSRRPTSSASPRR